VISLLHVAYGLAIELCVTTVGHAYDMAGCVNDCTNVISSQI